MTDIDITFIECQFQRTIEQQSKKHLGHSDSHTNISPQIKYGIDVLTINTLSYSDMILSDHPWMILDKDEQEQ